MYLKVVGAVLLSGPVLREIVNLRSVDGMVGVGPVNPVAGLVLVDVEVHRNVHLTITIGIGVVFYLNRVIGVIIISVLGLIVPVLEPLVIVGVSAGAAVGMETTILQQVTVLFLIDVVGVVAFLEVG